jgi:hypothetical protein
MTAPNENPQNLTPSILANQLFDAALAQDMSNPRGAAQRVVGFLTDSLFHAVTATKTEVVVFLTETLILVASASVKGDEAARKELLKHIGDTITNAPAIPTTAAGAAIPQPVR